MTAGEEQQRQGPKESGSVLYVCPRDGRWLATMGIAESISKAFGGSYEQRCAECGMVMARATSADRIRILDNGTWRDSPPERVYAVVATLGPVGAAGIALATGLAENAVDAALRLLLKQGMIENTGDVMREEGEGTEPGYIVSKSDRAGDR